MKYVLILFFLMFAVHADDPKPPCFKLNFSPTAFNVKSGLPDSWVYRTKLFVNKPKFHICTDPKTNTHFLRITCGPSHSGMIATPIVSILKKYPVIRWKWRVNVYPSGADGRISALDDQAIALYVASDIPRSNAVAYRWETETPKNYKKKQSYLAGLVNVIWYVMRNRKDGLGRWYIEERNAAEDFRKTYGFIPDQAAVSIAANAQHTGSASSADIEWIEFRKAPVGDSGIVDE